MKKHFLLTLLLSLCALSAFAAKAPKPQVLKSPDGRIAVSVDKFKYSVTADGVQMLAPSAISMTLEDGTVWGGGAPLVKALRKSVDETFDTPVYKKASVRNRYNELTLRYKAFDLVFRAYNEGVAYRFVSRSDKRVNVKAEQAEFTFPGNWDAVVPYCRESDRTIEKQIECSFENVYYNIKLQEWDKTRAAFLPLVVCAPNGYRVAITEADLFNFPGLNVRNLNGSTTIEGFHALLPKQVKQGGHNMLQGVILSHEDVIARDCKPQCEFPWRVIQVAREDKELACSDMVYKLAKAPEQRDWSWVKPGKVAWDWWNDWNLYGVDFKAGINNDTYKYYIDFASANGIEYVILDEGWAVNKQADLMQVVPEIDLEELCAYAKEKNVGLILWAGYWAVNRDMENVFLHFSRMGVKGFKIDFMDRDDQAMVNFYTACAEMGVKYKMMIDFHGAYKPTGLHRTYPNVINFEGVHGLEQMKWLEDGAQQVVYDVTIPFIRMLAGPMDYTQGAMRNATARNYHPVNSEPMSPGTRCRQLAEYVIFDAPFTMLCDSPSNYLQEPECTKYIAGIPTVWDETLVLNGKIGQFITMARRSGDTWYVGSMTDWTPRDMTVELGFLPAGRYSVEIFKDGANAHRAARDYAKEEAVVNPGDRLKVHLAPGGGWVAKIVKQ